MKIRELASSVAMAALLAAMPLAASLPLVIAPSAVQAQGVSVSFDLFYDRLRPHGTWVRHDRHRAVWCPAVSHDWRPYTQGRWVYLSDRGWYFASDEPFAWAAYHYGRWYDDDRLGWCWVPGTVWAPAWVAWRRAPDYIGWAPLAPQEDGYAISIEVNIGEPPEDDWFFVPARNFLEPDLSVSVVYSERDPEIYRRTEYVGPVFVQNNIVINTVIDIDIIKQETGQDVPVVEAAEVDDPEAAGGADSGSVPVFSPEIVAPADDETPPDALEPEQAEQQLGVAESEPDTGEEGAESNNAPDAGPSSSSEGAGEESASPEAADCAQGEVVQDGACAPTPAQAEDNPPDSAPAEGSEAEVARPGEAPADAAPAQDVPAEQPTEQRTQEAPAESGPIEAEPAASAPAEQPAEVRAEDEQPAGEPVQEEATEPQPPAAEPTEPQVSAPVQQPAAPAAPCPEGQVPGADGACRPAG